MAESVERWVLGTRPRMTAGVGGVTRHNDFGGSDFHAADIAPAVLGYGAETRLTQPTGWQIHTVKAGVGFGVWRERIANSEPRAGTPVDTPNAVILGPVPRLSGLIASTSPCSSSRKSGRGWRTDYPGSLPGDLMLWLSHLRKTDAGQDPGSAPHKGCGFGRDDARVKLVSQRSRVSENRCCHWLS